MTQKILEFPNKTFEVFPSSREEAQSQIESIRQEYCDEITEDVLESMTSVLHSYGFSIKSQEAHIKDIVFLEETIKAVLYRYKKIHHNLHEVIDSSINITPEASEALQNNR